MTGWEHTHPLKWLTISTIDTFCRCPRAFFYNYLCWLKEMQEHPALNFGSSIHKGVGEMQIADLSADPRVRSNSLITGMEAFNSVWKYEDLNDEKRNRYRAQHILMHYHMNRCGGKSIYVLQKPPKAVPDAVFRELVGHDPDSHQYEIPFAIPIAGLSIPLLGRIDGLVRHRDTGELWCLELKTSSEVSTRFHENFRINPQVVGYPYVLSAYVGERVVGTMVESVLVSKTRNDTMLTPFRVHDGAFAAFEKWVRIKGNEILARIERQDFEQDLSGCAPYAQFGSIGYPCRYASLCEVEFFGGDWTALKDTYRVEEYIPFEVTGVAEKPKSAVVQPTVNGQPVRRPTFGEMIS